MDHNASPQSSVATDAEQLVYFPRSDGSRIPYKVYSSPEIYRLEQERIFHGPVASQCGMRISTLKMLIIITHRDGFSRDSMNTTAASAIWRRYILVNWR